MEVSSCSILGRVSFHRGTGVRPRTGFWGRVREGLGAGLKLVSAEEVILSMSSARSGLALTNGGLLLMVTCSAATMAEFAQVMHALGAVQATYLDGRASFGLVYGAGYLTSPGRAISNALVVLVYNMDFRDLR